MTFRGFGVVFLLAGLGCGPVVGTDTESDSSSTGLVGDASTGSVPGTSTTSSPPLPATTVSTQPVPPPPQTTSGSESGGDDNPPVDPCGCNFVCPGDPCPPKGCPGYDPDCGPNNFECDVWSQDCGTGEKCMPWANDGTSVWNATRCVPILANPDQVGEPCTVEGSGVSGIDSCDTAQMCFDVDERLSGTCVGFCGDSPANPVCPQDQACSISNDGVLTLCLPVCDPLLPTCAEGRGCFPAFGSEAFVCLPAPHEGIESPWTCRASGGCEPGTVCVDASVLPECADEQCCTPYCDLADPTCPPDTECSPLYEDGVSPPGYENVGVCTQPG